MITSTLIVALLASGAFSTPLVPYTSTRTDTSLHFAILHPYPPDLARGPYIKIHHYLQNLPKTADDDEVAIITHELAGYSAVLEPAIAMLEKIGAGTEDVYLTLDNLFMTEALLHYCQTLGDPSAANVYFPADRIRSLPVDLSAAYVPLHNFSLDIERYRDYAIGIAKSKLTQTQVVADEITTSVNTRLDFCKMEFYQKKNDLDEPPYPCYPEQSRPILIWTGSELLIIDYARKDGYKPPYATIPQLVDEIGQKSYANTSANVSINGTVISGWNSPLNGKFISDDHLFDAKGFIAKAKSSQAPNHAEEDAKTAQRESEWVQQVQGNWLSNDHKVIDPKDFSHIPNPTVSPDGSKEKPALISEESENRLTETSHESEQNLDHKVPDAEVYPHDPNSTLSSDGSKDKPKISLDGFEERPILTSKEYQEKLAITPNASEQNYEERPVVKTSEYHRILTGTTRETEEQKRTKTLMKMPLQKPSKEPSKKSSRKPASETSDNVPVDTEDGQSS